LGKDALASEELSAEADYETEHGEATIPGFSKLNEAEAGSGIGHECFGLLQEL
jgi:hypothetical protein